MGYWIHVYSRLAAVMTADNIRELFAEAHVTIRAFGIETAAGWTRIQLEYPNGMPIARMSHRPIGPTMEAVEQAFTTEPSCNAEWVAEFYRGVKTIYALDVFDVDDGAENQRHVQSLIDTLSARYDCITYVDQEGFSNQRGDQITWGYSVYHRSKTWAALYDARTARWLRFQIDPRNHAHRIACRAGRVPDGVEVR
jgi:hypothetical protein